MSPAPQRNAAPPEMEDLRTRPMGMAPAEWSRRLAEQNPIGVAASTPYWDDPGAMGDSIECHTSDLEDIHPDV